LARKLGRQIERKPIPPGTAERTAWADTERRQLRNVVRYKPVQIQDTWTVAMAKHRDLQSISYLFQLNNRLSASGIWLRSILQSSDTSPVTIVLNDNGKEASTQPVWQHFSRGEQVLALDPMFMGSAWKEKYPFLFAQMLDSLGDRPLGMEAAQLIRIAQWAEHKAHVDKVRLEVSGIRSQAVAVVAAALEPRLFSEVMVRDGMHSFSYVLEKPVTFEQAPELFCLDLYKNFDIDRLEAIAGPVAFKATEYRDVAATKP
jgi:hypothetical protein